jgi:hypothetical protein
LTAFCVLILVHHITVMRFTRNWTYFIFIGYTVSFLMTPIVMVIANGKGQL